ncbi:MAG: hypothetical protein AAFV53_31830, partial [Myxococcota bacterium]
GKGAIGLFLGISAALTSAYFVAIDQNNAVAFTYLACTAGSLTFGGLQLRENTFVARMRTDPRMGAVRIVPTTQGVLLTGRF